MATRLIDEELLAALRVILRISLRAADELGGFSGVQLRALTVLQRHDRANLAQLAEGMGVTASTADLLVDRLVAAELVHRRVVVQNPRETQLQLASAGRQLLERYETVLLKALHAWFSELPDATGAVAIEGLRALGSGAGS